MKLAGAELGAPTRGSCLLAFSSLNQGRLDQKPQGSYPSHAAPPILGLGSLRVPDWEGTQTSARPARDSVSWLGVGPRQDGLVQHQALGATWAALWPGPMVD